MEIKLVHRFIRLESSEQKPPPRLKISPKASSTSSAKCKLTTIKSSMPECSDIVIDHPRMKIIRLDLVLISNLFSTCMISTYSCSISPVTPFYDITVFDSLTLRTSRSDCKQVRVYQVARRSGKVPIKSHWKPP